MLAKSLNPILNVSSILDSFAWFEKLGWEKAWDWGTPPTFGAVCSGECTIFLCQDGPGGQGPERPEFDQGGLRGRGPGSLDVDLGR